MSDRQEYEVVTIEIVPQGWRVSMKVVGGSRWGKDFEEVEVVLPDRVACEVRMGDRVRMVVSAMCNPPRPDEFRKMIEELE